MATKRRAACVIIALLLHDEECYKKKRLWCKEWYLKRAKFSHMNLLRELRVLSKSDLQNFLRMNETHFQLLLTKVAPHISKQNTIMRDAISAEERLTITSRFLATGRSYEDLKFTCAISPQSLRIIVPETCCAICKTLKKEYLKVGENKIYY
jgi:hypothetical protein